MPTIPSAISLDTAVGPEIKASEHNTNYSALQTAVNDLIALLAGGSVADVLTKTGASAAGWSTPSTTTFGTALPGSPSNGDSYMLTDSVTAPTYVWNLRYVSAAAKWYPQGASWGYGTTLPTVPAGVDKVEFTLVDSVTLPTYQWTFRYNAGSSNTDKWEFVGGAPKTVEVAASESTTSASYAALGTAGPAITLPRAGVYEVELGAYMSTAANGNGGVMSYDIGGTGAVDADSIEFDQPSGQNSSKVNVTRTMRKSGLAAVTLTAKYKSVGGGTQTFANRWLRVVPVRVS